MEEDIKEAVADVSMKLTGVLAGFAKEHKLPLELMEALLELELSVLREHIKKTKERRRWERN